ncbi:MAG: type VI secretion system baseplate subunit TssK [bacterium]
MARLQKVVWYEGMNLDPHHFQQMDRAFRAILNARVRAQARYDWGFSELQINKEALANGQIALLSCKGVTPDGLAFDMPEEDRLPKARALNEFFPATAEKLEVFLAIHAELPTGRNCHIPPTADNGEARYSLEYFDLRDDNSGDNSRAIGLARSNFQLRFSVEALDEFSWLKAAEIKRAPNGTFVLSDRFIPPCLSLAASENLMSLANDLLGRMVSKSAEQRGQLPFGKPEFTTNELTSLWLAQTLNTFIPIISHLYNVARCHPHELYMQWLALAGQLATYPTDLLIRPSDLPRYDHQNLTQCCQQLANYIQEQLELIKPAANYVLLQLKKQNENMWFSQQIPEPLLQMAQLYLVASGDIDERRMTAELPQKIKVAAPENIHMLIAAAARGLNMAYQPRPPAGVPAGGGQQYFHLEKTGFFWEAISKGRAVAIYLPGEFANLRIELIALRAREGGG